MTEGRDKTAETRGERSGHDARRHEANVVDMRAVWLCLFVLLVLIVGAQPVVSALLRAYTAGAQRPSASGLQLFDPGSAEHWNNPEADLAALRRKEDQHLNSYAWIDRETKRVQIPIERAMELLAQRRGQMKDNVPADHKQNTDQP